MDPIGSAVSGAGFVPPLPAVPFDPSAASTSGPIPSVKREEDDEPLPENASETVYVRNLNEKVRLPILKETLTNLFSLYGDVLSVTAHSNLRMRGQAFIALDNKTAANKAVKEVQGFPLYGRPVQLAFAKTLSDSVVAAKAVKTKREDGEEAEAEAETGGVSLEEHKKQRLEKKKETRSEWRKKRLERKLADGRAAAGETDGQAAATAAAQRRQNVQLPDEYVPPNKILFLQNIAAKVTKDDLDTMFSAFSNLVEVRTIPGKSDIAFVEFTDIPSSAAARERLNGHAFPDGTKLKITYARA
ncbi:hypothetical protein OC846_000525 [Tilletia horrida]|uniref:RRM domain-containing protein n=1 Tax=Tilletia horrida TaxID=155126 RepID=A0AAN6GVG0_9BASI|nr:hypothetical protein OC846_000525 [Tilletia horrida]